MKTKMKNRAIILAGGSGSRFGADRPKQYCQFEGKLVIEHCIDKFQSHAQIDEIIVVCSPEWEDFIWELKAKNNYSKLTQVAHAGKERYQSSISALNCVENNEDNILIHDAARAFVSPLIIDRVIEALISHKAVSVGVEPTDTIMELDKNGYIHHIPKRAMLRKVQTPQGFKAKLIIEAYEAALKDENIAATDDCGIVLKYKPTQSIYVVKGEESNLKITFPSDIQN